MSLAGSAIKQQLVAVLERYAAAYRLARQAHDLDVCGLDEPGPDAACPGCRTDHYCHERELAAQEFVALSMELGDLLLCLLRHCLKRRADDLRALLMELLAPDLTDFLRGFLAQRNDHARRD